MTSVGCCGFECGQIGSAGQHWVVSVGSPVIDTATTRTGARSLRCNASSAQCMVKFVGAQSAVLVVRIYIRFATLPSGDCTVVGGSGAGMRFRSSDSKLYMHDGVSTFGSSGVPVTTNIWYRLDVRIDAGTDTWDGAVDGVALGPVTDTLFGTSQAFIGIGGSVTADIYFDDFIFSNTSADYPIGAGYVTGHVPNRDVRHTCTGTNINEGTTGAPTTGLSITATVLDAFSYVNARPIGGGASDATRLINQNAIAATEYVEVGFEPVVDPSAVPRAVEALIVNQQAAIQAGTSSFKLVDVSTESVVLARSGAGVASDQYTTKHYATAPADSTAWTLDRFNNLRMRFGYSDDATPDQYWRGAMLEAEFPAVTNTIYRRLPPTQRVASDA